MKEQAEGFGSEFVLDTIQEVELEGKVKKLILNNSDNK